MNLPLLKECCTCHELKPLSKFNKRQQSSDGLQSRCRDCSRMWYLGNRTAHMANAALRRNRVRGELQDKLARYLQAHPCVDCGETDIRCLEFDHLDPTAKVAAVSFMVQEVWSWARIIAEIQKCVVRCSNCHRRKEAESRSLWRHRWLLRYAIDR